jgi:hypothetical protein
MIVTELYDGQGLGNQLWCYVVTRIISEKNGYDFGVMGMNKFKGRDFMTIDIGTEVIGGEGPEGGPPTTLPETIDFYYKEKIERHPQSNIDVTKFDNNLLDIKDNTKIDGTMQSYNYVKDYKEKIKTWIKVNDIEPYKKYSSDEICIIHIRGGDFKGSIAMLYSSYYNNCINEVKKIKHNMLFYIVTDDVRTAKTILPNIPIIGSSSTNINDKNKASHHIGGPINIDYYILNNAKNVIMSASSFGWWAVWTNNLNPKVIAPKYWAAHKEDSGYWSCGESLISGWDYMGANGKLYSHEECKNEI